MANEEDVRRIALSLPGVTQDTNRFGFSVEGKGFAWSYMERIQPKKPRVRRPDVLAIRVASEWDKQALLALDHEKFFTTDHYNGYPAVLVNLPLVDDDELGDLLIGGWCTRAPTRLIAEFQSRQGRPA